MIEPAFLTLLVTFVGLPPLLEPGVIAAGVAAIAVSAITVRADEEHRKALRDGTHPVKQDRVAVYRRHTCMQARQRLDNGTRFVAG